MIHHGIHVPGRHQVPQPRLSQNPDTVRVLPVRLGNDAHLIAMGFQDPADNGMPKGRMIHVGVPRNIYKIALLPVPFFHIFPGNR